MYAVQLKKKNDELSNMKNFYSRKIDFLLKEIYHFPRSIIHFYGNTDIKDEYAENLCASLNDYGYTPLVRSLFAKIFHQNNSKRTSQNPYRFQELM